MISLRFRTCVLVALGFCLAACSLIPKMSAAPQPPPPPPAPIRSIAIVQVAEPQSEQILVVGSALSTDSDSTLSQPRQDYSQSYTQLLAAKNALFVPDMVKTLTATLGAEGYRVTYLADQKAFISADGKSDDLSQVHSDADAILVVRLTGAGYVSSRLEASYQPWITASARLIRNSNKAEIYFKTFSGGYEMTAQSSVYLPSSSQYRYLYFRDLTGAVDESIRGLKQSVSDIANAIAEDLAEGAPGVAVAQAVTPMPAANAAPAKDDAKVTAATAPAAASNDAAQTSSNAIAPSSNPAAPEAPALPTLKKDTPVYTRPDPKSILLAKLSAGSKIDQTSAIISNEHGDWLYIHAGDIHGWILAAALKP